MLLHVKGRRHVQTRLVEPVATSINKGDNYILVTGKELYHYIGNLSNFIEQSRAADVVNHIQQTGDLGCKPDKVVVINPKKESSSKDIDKFWKHLGTVDDIKIADAGHPDEDEIYEANIIGTNMIYKFENNELVPVDKYWGKVPKIEMLESDKTFVFDFGTEMYIWSGKNAPIAEKKQALSLAEDLWNEGYNYSECDVCPLNVASVLGFRNDTSVSLKSNSRPEWALFAKLTQHRETVLFREKFLDWPDFSRVIKVKEDEGDKNIDASIEINPCNAEELLKAKFSEPDFEVDGSHLGRGKEFYDEESNRNFQVQSLGVTKWSILENTYEKLDEKEVGQFYEGDTYIIRWQFRVTVTGRELSGKPSKHMQVGRDRCLYFLWLGETASTNEKGVAALLTVELDSENARQIRVTQGSEPPVFLQLFKGRMVIHSGKKDCNRNSKKRLYIVRGDIAEETVLNEVPCSAKSLRSRGSFIYVDGYKNSVAVWHGAKSSKNTRVICTGFADFIAESDSSQYGIEDDVDVDILEVDEGDSEFLQNLNGDQEMYHSLVDSENKFDTSPRLFHMTSISGSFEATEVPCPHRSSMETPFPFLQSDLYSASQPGKDVKYF